MLNEELFFVTSLFDLSIPPCASPAAPCPGQARVMDTFNPLIHLLAWEVFAALRRAVGSERFESLCTRLRLGAAEEQEEGPFWLVF